MAAIKDLTLLILLGIKGRSRLKHCNPELLLDLNSNETDVLFQQA